jgi:hypothetical protein
VLKTLSTKQPTIKRLMEAFGQSIERSQKSGRAGGFTVMIDADGNPEISPLAEAGSVVEPIAEDDRLDNALQAARERGRLRSAEILSQDDMLTAAAFAERLGVSRVTVNARRQKHELLGLDGAKRGFRFPAWQVDEDGKTLDALPNLRAPRRQSMGRLSLPHPAPFGLERSDRKGRAEPWANHPGPSGRGKLGAGRFRLVAGVPPTSGFAGAALDIQP